MYASDLPLPTLIFVVIILLYLLNSIKILREYERASDLQAGPRAAGAQGAGDHSGLSADRPDGAHLAAAGSA